MRVRFSSCFVALLWTVAAFADDFAIRGVTVVGDPSASPIANATVVIRGDRIASIGPAAEVVVPDGMRVHATRRSARFLRVGDSVGTIERGKIADLVLLDANPLDDIANTKLIRAVIVGGKLYDQAAMQKLLAGVLNAPDLAKDEWGRH